MMQYTNECTRTLFLDISTMYSIKHSIYISQFNISLPAEYATLPRSWLWGETTPEGRLYPGLLQREVLAIGWLRGLSGDDS